jgi:hypothetical protein
MFIPSHTTPFTSPTRFSGENYGAADPCQRYKDAQNAALRKMWKAKLFTKERVAYEKQANAYAKQYRACKKTAGTGGGTRTTEASATTQATGTGTGGGTRPAGAPTMTAEQRAYRITQKGITPQGFQPSVSSAAPGEPVLSPVAPTTALPAELAPTTPWYQNPFVLGGAGIAVLGLGWLFMRQRTGKGAAAGRFTPTRTIPVAEPIPAK